MMTWVIVQNETFLPNSFFFFFSISTHGDSTSVYRSIALYFICFIFSSPFCFNVSSCEYTEVIIQKLISVHFSFFSILCCWFFHLYFNSLMNTDIRYFIIPVTRRQIDKREERGTMKHERDLMCAWIVGFLSSRW